MASSNEILLNIEGFDSEIEQFTNSVTEVASIESKQVLDIKKQSILESMDMMMSILDSFAKSMDAYVALSRKDINEMKVLKERWVNKDAEIAHDIEGT
ncbi:hypothetical protein [Pueribacillus sp. YX66]|uniref:hypothetical protein n=1 Tax=Pueribacillus sp. YX66 TaxID=3229242 RepID=UPI00358D0EA9